MKLKGKFYIFFLIITLLTGCTFYTFVDGSTKYEETTKIRIKQFVNNAGNGPPDMSAIFTEKTKDYYIQNGKFQLEEINPDLLLICEITNYSTGIAGGTSNQTSAQSKLTITVSVEFIDNNNPDNNITKNYPRFELYDRNADLSSVEEGLVDLIADQIVTDIFNGTTMKSEW